jgi:hypothetical protein
MRKNIRFSFLFTIVLLLVGLISSFSYGQQQLAKGGTMEDYSSQLESQHVIGRAVFPNEPVEVVAIESEGKPITAGKWFKGRNSWLDDMSFEVKNNSNKKILFLELKLEFDRTVNTDGIVEANYIRLQHGYIPGVGDTPAQVSLIPVGSKIALRFTKEMAVAYRKQFPQLNKVSKLKLSLGTVVFADDTLWAVGMMFRRKANEPGNWLPMEEAATNKIERAIGSNANKPATSKAAASDCGYQVSGINTRYCNCRTYGSGERSCDYITQVSSYAIFGGNYKQIYSRCFCVTTVPDSNDATGERDTSQCSMTYMDVEVCGTDLPVDSQN